MLSNLINLSICKTAEMYNAVINHQLVQYKEGLKVERVEDNAVIIRIGRKAERVSNDALVALATAGREVTAHDIAVLRNKVERKANERGLVFAKVALS